MGSKTLIWLGILVGSSVGGIVPAAFGVDLLSDAGLWWGILGSTIGAILGIYLAYKLINY